MKKAAHLFIKGLVIGVGFRAWTKYQAEKLGLIGWVKNVYNQPEVFGPGGGVEAFVQGEKEKISNLIKQLKIGPVLAKVEKIKVIWQEPTSDLEEFIIKY